MPRGQNLRQQRAKQGFKVKVEFAKDEFGQETHQPLTIGVTRNADIRTVQDAVAHCTRIIGVDADGKPVTHIHYKDENTGEFFSIVKCEPVQEEPFDIDAMPEVRTLESAPQKPSAAPSA